MIQPHSEYAKATYLVLHQIPSEWNIIRAKNLFRCIDIRSETGEEELLTVSSKFGVIKRKCANVTMFKAASYKGYKLCWEGDLVINSLWAWMTGLGFSNYNGIVSTAYGVYRLHDRKINHPKYYNFLLRSIAYRWELMVRSKGVWISRLQLTNDSFLNIPMLNPPFYEQVQIARYLDYKNYQINKYIRIKKRQIELLKELKQVIINDAMTGKIDVRTGEPYIKYKDSGIDWLGMIPEEWIATRFRNVCYLQRGHDLSSDKFIKGEYPVMGSNGVIGYHNQFTTKAPNITVGRSGSTGKVNFVNEDFWAHNTALFVLHNHGNDWNWLYYFILNFDMAAVSEGSAVPTLNRNYIHKIHVSVPKRENQEDIASYIENVIDISMGAIKIIEDEITLIRELQTRLISDIVTGKLDVRDIEVPDIPEEELEPGLESDDEPLEESISVD